MFKTKTQIRQILQENNFRPNKKLGQNFLCDQNIINKIVDQIPKDQNVLEIGPGLGSLTFFLAKKSRTVTAVEIDKGYFNYLQDQKNKNKIENLTVINQDILKFDLNTIQGPITLIGNLPYYISGPILFWMLENRHLIEKAVIMVQQEVAERLLSGKDNKVYGKTTVLFDLFAEKELLCTVSKHCFYPEPQVASQVLSITFKQKKGIEISNEALLFDIIKAGFGKRRKKIANAIKEVAPDVDINVILEKCNIDKNARAENLGCEDFVLISNKLEVKSQKSKVRS
ncbi:16S rRNA (adenine(1518)-N(6)/adenine(1519)-N(6))-dimethyltransferase RsmA [bacterium]|nr:16S rRNA (adenine(1518)-N(6)/adenine(1519)-N(6))-dimethyltransferase RsmA [bacterium]